MKVRLEEVCDFINGGAWSQDEYSDSGIPVLKVSNLQRDSIDFTDIDFLPVESLSKYSKNQLLESDLVIATVGSHPGMVNSAAGRAVTIPKAAEGYLLNQNAVCVRTADPKILSQRYLDYIGKTHPFQHYIQQRGKGAANQMRIAIEAIKDYEISLPSLPIQRHIAKVLGCYDALIENYQRQISLLEATAQEVYREWFVRGRCPYAQAQADGVPVGWEEKSLGDIATDTRRIVKVQDLDPNSPYVGLEHLSVKSIVVRDWGIADDVDSDKLVFEKNDILFGKIRPYQHKVCLSHFEGVCSSDTIVIQPLLENALGFLIFTVFDEKFVDFADKISNGTKMPRAEWNVLRTYKMVVPTADVLERFDRIARPVFSKIENLHTQITQLRRMRDKLLPRLMSGQLEVAGQTMP
jgi:type I restriction enzyme, S subunit